MSKNMPQLKWERKPYGRSTMYTADRFEIYPTVGNFHHKWVVIILRTSAYNTKNRFYTLKDAKNFCEREYTAMQKPPLVVNEAVCHFSGDMSVGLFPHTVVVSGLDFHRDHFDYRPSGDTEFKDALDMFRKDMQNALNNLLGERFTVSFDFEIEAEKKMMVKNEVQR